MICLGCCVLLPPVSCRYVLVCIVGVLVVRRCWFCASSMCFVVVFCVCLLG